jgi:FtsZ-interacting cell division protein ZipA
MTAPPQTPPAASQSQGASPLQWFRELVTALIAVVILAIAGATLYGTWTAAARVETDKEKSAAQKDAYERQKDVMLYALALLGTVTGYYLGRVPAENHAQQAQRAAQSAQKQLASTQERLADAAGSAAAAAGQVSSAEKEKQQAQQKMREAHGALEGALQKMSTAVSAMDHSRTPSSGPGAQPLGAPPDSALDELRAVWQEIDRLRERLKTSEG